MTKDIFFAFLKLIAFWRRQALNNLEKMYRIVLEVVTRGVNFKWRARSWETTEGMTLKMRPEG